jgi:hypothetical protein
MFLVHPNYLMGDEPLPNFAVCAYAQVLCEDFAQRIGVPAPRVVVSDRNELALSCQSPVKRWVRWTREGDLALAPFTFDPLQLQFAIGHALAHCVYALEWECDLEALAWMNDPMVPLVESTARAIAQTLTWRARVPNSELGIRVLMIGDALTSEIW